MSIIATTLQAAALAALSNVLAQVIKTFQDGSSFALDIEPLIQFVAWALISTPPNVYWQMYLEEKFPSTTSDAKGQKTLSKSNTIKKFLLDQTVGSVLNNAAFIAGMSTFKGKTTEQTLDAIVKDLWPLMSSGLKLWPAVSLLNFTVIPADSRILFGSTIGLFWGIYLSLLTSA